MTETGCKIRKAAITSFILLLASALVTSVNAQVFVSWWVLIHCSGASGVDHTPGEEPDNESYLTNGNAVSQCHGTPGELGSCSDSDLGASWNVGCVPNYGGSERCTARVDCPDGSQLICGGIGQSAFAGIISNGQNGDTFAFVVCQSASGAVLSEDKCPLGEGQFPVSAPEA